MEFAWIDPALLLRAYEALMRWFAWTFAAAACVWVLIFLVLSWSEWSSASRRPVAKPQPSGADKRAVVHLRGSRRAREARVGADGSSLADGELPAETQEQQLTQLVS